MKKTKIYRKKMPPLKIECQVVQVILKDNYANGWIVEFTGEGKDLTAKVYKNGNYQTVLTPIGNAHRSMALRIVKNINKNTHDATIS